MGFVPAGETNVETFRVITKKSYPLPGAEIKVGGRQRFSLPDTNRFVTVGARTTCFYEVVNGKAQNFANFNNKKDFDGIQEILQLAESEE